MSVAEDGAAEGIERLRQIVARLRSPQGCPWDREQNHSSLRPALIEEAYEIIDAIDAGDFENLQEELGDLLLHVAMHAQMAAEAGRFGLGDVIDGICEKLVRRHPHVFSDGAAADSDAVLRQWEEIKKAEKPAGASIMDGIPKALPAAMRAQKAQKKAARAGYDWSSLGEVLEKVAEESIELRDAIATKNSEQIEMEAGDLLFSAVNAARFAGVDAETALLGAVNRFVTRVRRCESLARQQGRELRDLDEPALDRLWERAKSEGEQAPTC